MPKRRHAAALRYDSERGGAPRVVAAGSGVVAERIIALARENGVPVHDDAGLAEALARLQLEAEVPEELWAAVAEALVWAYKLTSRGQRFGAVWPRSAWRRRAALTASPRGRGPPPRPAGPRRRSAWSTVWARSHPSDHSSG